MISPKMVFQMYCALVASGKTPGEETIQQAQQEVQLFNDQADQAIGTCDYCGYADCEGDCGG